MFRYIMSRIAAMLITLFLIMSLSFIVVRLMPMSLFENPEVPLEIQKQLEDKFAGSVFLFYFGYSCRA